MDTWSETERLRRRPVWAALSELYLDTEVRVAIPHIAQVLLASGYAPEEITAIWRDEITPVLHFNLKHPAGEWAGFDPTWLEAQIDRGRPAAALLADDPERREALYRSRAGSTDLDFVATLACRERLARVPEGERPQYVAVLSAMAEMYFDPRPLFPETQRDRLRASGLSTAQLEQLFATEFEPVFAPLLRHDTRTPAAARAAVEALIARAGG